MRGLCHMRYLEKLHWRGFKSVSGGHLHPLDDDRHISAILRDWQSKEALTQIEAAKVLGVPRRTFQAWLYGERVAHERLLRAALAVLPRD